MQPVKPRAKANGGKTPVLDKCRDIVEAARSAGATGFRPRVSASAMNRAITSRSLLLSCKASSARKRAVLSFVKPIFIRVRASSEIKINTHVGYLTIL